MKISTSDINETFDFIACQLLIQVFQTDIAKISWKNSEQNINKDSNLKLQKNNKNTLDTISWRMGFCKLNPARRSTPTIKPMTTRNNHKCQEDIQSQ